MSFNDFCKYMIDKYNEYVCEDTGFIKFVESKCSDYMTHTDDFDYWVALYTLYQR